MSEENQANACQKHYETVCEARFDRIEETLNRIDVGIRGNGKPGIGTRLALVEESIKTQKWVSKAIVVAAIGLIVNCVLLLVK